MKYSRLIATLVMLGLSVSLFAEPIRLGQSIPLSGLFADIGKEYRDGALAYFGKINQSGGVHGQPIELISLDDGYVVDKTLSNARSLVEEHKVLAFFGLLGTANVAALKPLISEQGIPTIAPLTGSAELRAFDPNIFWLRASYAQEAEKIVEQLVSIGIRRIAVFHQNDPFGLSGLKGVQDALAKRKLEIVAKSTFEKNSVNVSEAVRHIGDAAPQAVIMISANRPTAMFVKEMRARQKSPLFFGISVIGLRALVDEIGDAASGIAVSQVVPSPNDGRFRLVREFRNLPSELRPPAGLTFTALEGYLAAKVVVEALRRAGPNASRSKLVSALESLAPYDAGDIAIHFSRNNHNGSQFIELTMIGKNGKVIK